MLISVKLFDKILFWWKENLNSQLQRTKYFQYLYFTSENVMMWDHDEWTFIYNY